VAPEFGGFRGAAEAGHFILLKLLN
jgi:hypothetical protein